MELTEIDTTVGSDDGDLAAGLSLGSSSRGLESIESASDAGGDLPLGPPPLPKKVHSGAKGARAGGGGGGDLVAGLAAAQMLQQQRWARTGGSFGGGGGGGAAGL